MKKLILLLVGILVLCSCTSKEKNSYILKDQNLFQDHTIIGVWQKETLYDEVETIRLHADKTYEHTFKVESINLDFYEAGQWYIERRTTGCVYLHLQDMRYFLGTIDVEGTRNDAYQELHLYEPCEKKTMDMSKDFIMTVIDWPNLPKHIALIFPYTSLENTVEFMKLIEPKDEKP